MLSLGASFWQFIFCYSPQAYVLPSGRFLFSDSEQVNLPIVNKKKTKNKATTLNWKNNISHNGIYKTKQNKQTNKKLNQKAWSTFRHRLKWDAHVILIVLQKIPITLPCTFIISPELCTVSIVSLTPCYFRLHAVSISRPSVLLKCKKKKRKK